jgi:surface antigen
MTVNSALLKNRSFVGRVAVCIALSASSCYALSNAASAAVSNSTLCHGYVACSQDQFTTHGYQAHSGTSYWNMNAGNNCTNYVAFVESTVYGVATPAYRLGDAGEWPQTSALHGAVVNHVPTVGSVAEWNGGSPGIPFPGHVAIVEAIGPRDSYIVISQQIAPDVDDFDWIRINADSATNQWEQWPSSFIHFAGVHGSLRVDSKSSVVHIVVRATPVRFSGDAFAFSNGVERLLTPGLTSGLNARLPFGEYQVGFRDVSLQGRYVLHVTVNGSNVMVLHQGGPYATSLPTIRIAHTEKLQTPSVVTINVRPVATSPTTTTQPLPTSTIR